MNFDQKASIYEKISSSQKIAAEHLISMMDINGNDSIIDVGCGTGYLTELLYSKAKNTEGVDISTQMVEQAKELRPHIRFTSADAEHLNTRDMYDWIVTNAVTYYFKDLPETILKFYQALRQNGKYALQAQVNVTPQFINAMSGLLNNDITKEYYTNFKLSINHLNINEFLVLLINSGFTIVKAEMINYKNEVTVDEAFNIFKSGTATPFLNPSSYSKELSQSYIDKFWEIVYSGLQQQACQNVITLDTPRCFIIAEKK